MLPSRRALLAVASRSALRQNRTDFVRPLSSAAAAPTKTRVSSHTDFQPLKHVVVGRPDGSCIAPDEPASKCRIPVDSEMRGKWGMRPQKTIDAANVQMDGLCELLESHGIVVDRPEFIKWDEPIETPFFKSPGEFGCMPPRDVLLTVGNEILEATMSYRSRWFEYRAYRPLLKRLWAEDPNFRWEAAPKPELTDASYKTDYLEDHDNMSEAERLERVANRDFVTQDWTEPLFDAADVLRFGKDLFVQHGFTTNLAGIEWLRRHFPDYRVHALNFPGDTHPVHIDATFVPLRPGLILTNPSRPIPADQRAIFDNNGWEIVECAQPAHKEPPPLCYSSVWLSMNFLVLDEKHVLVEASEKDQIDQINSFGFEAVPIPFRDAYAFGGGLHCATADVLRTGDCEDYFPNQD